MIRENQCCNCKQIIENPDIKNGILSILYCNNCIEEARKNNINKTGDKK